LLRTAIYSVVFTFFSLAAHAEQLTSEVRTLAKCEGVYMYAAHLAQMQNNEGLTRNILFRAARTSVAVFMLSEKSGVISGKLIAQFADIHKITKGALDAQKLDVSTELKFCDKNALPITNSVERSHKILWGLDFQGLHLQVLKKFMQILGLSL
jgi:hypothetical protein